ncbi:aminopeptidase P family protein [Candidatus Bathyarchaeota archaeon]|nr:aminopeptidase P family protein [Candidatus Bathyarchaeota archaeon]
MDFRRRLRSLQSKMEENGLDLVVYGASPDFQYLTGTRVEWRRGRDLLHAEDNVFVPQKGDPILVLSGSSANAASDCWIKDIRIIPYGQPQTETIKKVVDDLGGNMSKVAVGNFCWGSTCVDLARATAGAKFRVGENLLDDIRMIKEQEEIIKLKKAAELTDQVMEVIIERIQDGLTQRNLTIMMEMMGRGLGASDISFGLTGGYLKSGTIPSDDPFIYPKDAGLQKGTSIAFDVGFVVDGYCSDWGRSFYWGTAPQQIKKGYEVLQAAVVSACDAIGKEIKRCCDIFPHIEKSLDKEGYGEFLRARLKTGNVGHQIGVEVHEDPWLRPDSTQELIDGMVFCVEPKIWQKGEYYLRVEDMILVKNGKGEFLSKYKRDQFQL